MVTKGSKSKRKGRKTFKFELAPFSMVLWVFGLFFLLAWIFVLGIFVGRGFLPGAVTALTDLKGQISRLQKMVSDDDDRKSAVSEKPDSDPKLAFYEKLSSKRDEAKKKWHPKKDTGPAREKKVGTDTGSGKTNSTKKELQHSPQTVQKPPQPVGENIQFTVQLASLTDRAGAEKMVRQLGSRGYKATYKTARINGKTYYRISCGKFGNREDAALYAVKIRKKAGLEGFVKKVE